MTLGETVANLYAFEAVALITGALMIAFPSIFIAFRDISAAFKGYTPIEGHPTRSKWLVRFGGIIFILFGVVVWFGKT